MNGEQRQILDMLAEQKISADEAERLLSALESADETSLAGKPVTGGAQPQYIRVLVDTVDPHEGPTKVNIRVPIRLLRAGVKLTGLIPDQARRHMNEAMREQGLAFDVNQLTPENLDDLVSQLNDLTVDVDQAETKVKVFCE